MVRRNSVGKYRWNSDDFAVNRNVVGNSSEYTDELPTTTTVTFFIGMSSKSRRKIPTNHVSSEFRRKWPTEFRRLNFFGFGRKFVSIPSQMSDDLGVRRNLRRNSVCFLVVGLGRRLPGGAWNYYAGTIQSFCQSNKVWGTDIDDIYAPVNFADSHWIAMWISIPKRHIVVFDSICSSISPEELDVVMEPFLYMVPYLLVECASSDEVRAQYSLEPFTYERPTNIPSARAGDCGVYTLKYIECHALGIEFSKKDFAKANGKSMRDKMAVDIFQELPDAHEFENKDNDANLGAYEG